MLLSVIEFTTYESMHRLAQTGMMNLPTANMQKVFPKSEYPKRNENLEIAIILIERADHKPKAALLLNGGGFQEETTSSAKDAVCIAVSAHATLQGQSEADSAESAAECLIGDELGQDTPHGVISLLTDGEFDGQVTEVAKRAVDRARNAIAYLSSD